MGGGTPGPFSTGLCLKVSPKTGKAGSSAYVEEGLTARNIWACMCQLRRLIEKEVPTRS